MVARIGDEFHHFVRGPRARDYVQVAKLSQGRGQA
jgi:hypothetical protein